MRWRRGDSPALNDAISKSQELDQHLSQSVRMLRAQNQFVTPETEKKSMTTSFAASLKAMMDEARAGVQQAREEGLAKVGEAVGKLHEAKAATAKVAGTMVKTIEDEAAAVLAELGQISNDL